MYVTTKSDSAVGEGTHSIPILEPNRLSLIRGNVDLANRIITDQFNSILSLEDVTQIEVEISPDSDDEEESDLITIYPRE
jgi:hypothetical protein